MTERCEWCLSDPLYIDYHDNEWGVPVHAAQKLFEMLILEGFQAGLSWLTVLKKRDAFREAFDQFDAQKISHYSDKKVEKLCENVGIIRNRLKINAAVKNAKAFLAIEKQVGGFDQFIWQFVDGAPIINHWQSIDRVPASTNIAERMSKALKKSGFSFVGPTICYAYMQSIGLVNDHRIDCFRHAELSYA